MEEENQDNDIKRIMKRLSLFFPEMIYSREMVEDAVGNNDVFIKPLDILPYLQTALLDEKILEVELNGMTRVYFSRLYDELPPIIEEEIDGQVEYTEPEYNTGDYLRKMTHIICLPLEPGMGNIHIRQSSRLMLRLHTANYAVELGCFYQEQVHIRGIPALRLAYPVIGRIVRGTREFRAKVPSDFDLKIQIKGKNLPRKIDRQVLNISARGAAFSIKKNQQEFFNVEDTIKMSFVQGGILLAILNGTVRHISKVRGSKGTEYNCGVMFDLVSRSLAAKIEHIVASVQRSHLKELSKLSYESGIDLKA